MPAAAAIATRNQDRRSAQAERERRRSEGQEHHQVALLETLGAVARVEGGLEEQGRGEEDEHQAERGLRAGARPRECRERARSPHRGEHDAAGEHQQHVSSEAQWAIATGSSESPVTEL